MHWSSVVFGTVCGLLCRGWFSAIDRRMLLRDLRDERGRNDRLVERLEAVVAPRSVAEHGGAEVTEEEELQRAVLRELLAEHKAKRREAEAKADLAALALSFAQWQVKTARGEKTTVGN